MTTPSILSGKGQGKIGARLLTSDHRRSSSVFVNVNANEPPPPALPPLASRLPPTSGFALVATLLMITVITGAAVAFFQSTRIERFVSRNYADLARAQLAAEAATAAGQALITALFTNYPDSCVAWALVPDVTTGSTNNLATFYFRTTNTSGFLTNGANAATPASQPVFLYAYPLASGANEAEISTFTSSAPVFTNTATPDGQAGLTTNNSYDLNVNNWIGTPPGGTKPALRAKWIEILKDPSQPKNTSLNSSGQPINPPIARYAFWAEDESFRVNLNRVGASPRGNNTPGTNPAEIALQGALSGNNATLAQGITNLQVTLRSNIPTPATMGLASPSGNYTNNRFVVSVHSSGLNLSRGGTLRLNLNQVISSSTDPSTIRSQLDRILAGITNINTNASPSNTAAMPAFGQRFYRLNTNGGTALNDTSVVTGTAGANLRTSIYLQKIAANIRDYIDSDSQPTVINNDSGFTINNNNIPWNAFAGGISGGNGPYDTAIASVGKEAVPLLTEYAVRVLLTSWQTNGTGTNRSADFVFRLFHYFEFWNPTTKDIPVSALGANPRLQVLNMYGFNVGAGGTISPSSPPVITANLDSFSGLTVFPANSFTILTTEPPGDATTCPFPNNSSFKRAPSSFTTYSGTTRLTSQVNGVYQPRVRPLLGTSNTPARAGTGSTDYDLWVSLINDAGTLESFTALPTAAPTGADPGEANALTVHNDSGNNINSSTFKWRSGSLRGNDSLSRSGDPRSLHEQMNIARYITAGDAANQTRFFTETSLGNVSLGQLNGAANYVNPNNWTDYSPAIPSGSTSNLSPYRHLDTPLDTIGRLGDVYDPALFLSLGSTDITLVRGGARTLKIGQSERWTNINFSGLWDGSETNASRNWTSWRLADVFATTNAVTLPGVININGALRDTNALSALVFGLIYESSPGGGQATSGRNLNVANFVTAVRTHLAGGTLDTNPSNDRLFWERGQISELADGTIRPLFSSPLNTLAGVALSTTQDRGREEVVRRIMDLVTTKGNVYSIYAIGQSLNPRTGQPVATQKIRRTFRIDPVFTPALPADNTFDPAQTGTGSATDRFRRPSGFTVTILHNSNE